MLAFLAKGEMVTVGEAFISRRGLGSGLYGVSDLSQYLSYARERRVRPREVLYWMRQGLTPDDHRPRTPDYNFYDLISLRVVQELLAAGVRLRQIKAAEAYFRDQIEIERPFAAERIYTDGVNILYRAAPQVVEQLTAANLRGQEVFEPVIEHALRGVGYEEGLASHWSIHAGVEIDPRIQFGEPCLARTRIPTALLYALAERGEGVAEIAELYSLPSARVEIALEFEYALRSIQA